MSVSPSEREGALRPIHGVAESAGAPLGGFKPPFDHRSCAVEGVAACHHPSGACWLRTHLRLRRTGSDAGRPRLVVPRNHNPSARRRIMCPKSASRKPRSGMFQDQVEGKFVRSSGTGIVICPHEHQNQEV
jgi:hypothetical protein